MADAPSGTLVPAGAPPVPGGLPGQEAILARAPQENFPVASRLLPRRYRGHLLAIYGYARLVDEIGDSVAGDRLARLDELEAELATLWRPHPAPSIPLLARLAPTVAELELPPGPFRALIEANRQDQRKRTYASYDELLAYCTLSADPVGELVLHVFGVATPERIARSNEVCSALQLAEHWQDVAEDYRAGRVYLPADDLARFGVGAEELAAPHAGEELSWLMAFEVERARGLLDRGAALLATLDGYARLAVAGYVGGGRAALEAIELAGYDVLARPPRAGKGARLHHAVAAYWRRA